MTKLTETAKTNKQTKKLKRIKKLNKTARLKKNQHAKISDISILKRNYPKLRKQQQQNIYNTIKKNKTVRNNLTKRR